MAETINRVVHIITWTLSSVAWFLTMVSWEGFTFFFTVWARVIHFIDLIRLVFVVIMKAVAFVNDDKQDYLIQDGTALAAGDTVVFLKVSEMQQLSSNDYYMEALSLSVSFSLYGDLLGISKWAKEAIKKEKETIKAQKQKTPAEKEKGIAMRRKNNSAKFPSDKDNLSAFQTTEDDLAF